MKEDLESEKYRQKLLKKVKQNTYSTAKKEEIWDRVMARVSENKKQTKIKPYVIWYSSAALILISLSVVFILYKWNSFNFQVLNNRSDERIVSGTQATIANPIKKDLPEDKTPVMKDHKTAELNNHPKFNTPVLQHTTPGIVNTPAITSYEKILLHNLSDGSKVTLNSNATLKIEESNSRELSVNLTGEAYFEVLPNKNRLFKVYFGNSYLQVLGTKFNVRNLSNEKYMEISVTEGLVRVYGKDDKNGTVIKQGQQLKIASSGEKELLQVDPYHFIYWKSGILSFKTTKLKEVAAMLTRVYNSEVMVDSNIKNCTFTGDLSQLSLDESLKVIEATTFCKIEKRNDITYISGSGCD
jgi:transmembrane sensor